MSRIHTLAFIPVSFQEWAVDLHRIIQIGVNKSFWGEESDIINEQLNQSYNSLPFSLYKKKRGKTWVRWLAKRKGNFLLFFPPLEFQNELDTEFQIHIRIYHQFPCYFFTSLEGELLGFQEEAKNHSATQSITLRDNQSRNIYFGFYSGNQEIGGKIRIRRINQTVEVEIKELEENEILPICITGAASEALRWKPNKTICNLSEINDINCQLNYSRLAIG